MLGRYDYTVKRYASGSYVDGRWVEGSETELTIKTSVQPLNGKELEALPEGRREKSSYKGYTSLYMQTVQNSENPDRIVIDGDEYEIFTVENWQSNIINHYKFIAQKT